MKAMQLTKWMLPALFALAIPYTYAADKYILDDSHTFVGWSISHFGYSHPTGKWMAKGTMELDKDKPQDSKVEATIKVGDIITGIPKLDHHLKGEEFFDVDKYPTATFVSTKVITTSKDTAKVEGNLTLHGVTRPVTLDVKLNKAEVSPMTNKMTAGFSATATISRSEFGIKAYTPGLGDEVKLTIEAEAFKSA